MRFFQLAFQQTQVSVLDFSDQSYPRNIAINTTTTPLLVQNAQESFARTMVELVAEHHPLTESATTQTFMMTTALKELYAFLDVWHVDDSGVVADRFSPSQPQPHDQRRHGTGADSHLRDARSHEPQLHALVQS